ncbi:hypothetical protein ACQEVU_22035 [Dactylosporangium sp. CA-139066]
MAAARALQQVLHGLYTEAGQPSPAVISQHAGRVAWRSGTGLDDDGASAPVW